MTRGLGLKALATAVLLAATVAACGGDSPTPSPTTPPDPTETAPTPSPTPTPSPQPTATVTATASPTPTSTSPTPVPAPTEAATPSPTASPTPAPEPTPTPTPTPEEPAEPVEPVEPTPAPATRPSLLATPTFDTPPGVYTTITVGTGHACALTEDGEAVCWNIATGNVWDTPPGHYTFIEAEGDEVCAITAEGEIVCRSNSWGPWSSDVVPAGRYRTIAMSAGYYCALTIEGRVVCWVTDQERPTPADPPAGVFTSIGVWSSVGHFPVGGFEFRRRTACATSEGGEAVCWVASWDETDPTRESQYLSELPGNYRPASTWVSNNCWLLADGRAPCMTSVDDPTRYEALATGGGHMCAITDGGMAVCRSSPGVWMAGRRRVITPPLVAEGFTAISLGDAIDDGLEVEPTYACALTETGRPVCWRDVSNKLIRPDPDPNRYVAVSDGLNHSCALTESAEALCWGWNDFGQAAAPPGRYVSISAGGDGSCALAESGEVACWGWSVSTIFESGGYQAVAVATGGGVWDGACVVTESGSVMCRQQGDDLYIDEVEYIESEEGPYATLGVGGSCGLTEEGAMVCWSGWRSHREGRSLAHHLPGSFVALSDGPGPACAVTEAGAVTCWRSTYRWGAEAIDQRRAGDYVAVSAGHGHACALTEEGEARCWGEFGAGGHARFGPVTPPPGRYSAISAGWTRTCALTGGGEVVCWGNTDYERASVPSK